MSSANCPFTIFPKKEDSDVTRRKDKYVTINIPLNPEDPNSQKITHEYSKLNSTEIKDVLEFFSTFDDIVNTLALPRGPQRFRLIPAMMGHDAQKKWFDIVNTYATNQTQDELEDCIERFLLLFMEEDISLDIKEWMSEVKKPRNMSVQDFVQRISHLNDLIDYTPIPDPTNNPDTQTPKFTDAELARIVRNACPAGWKKAQVQANIHHLNLAAQTRYYTGLKSVEPNDITSHRNKSHEAKSPNRRAQTSQSGVKPKINANSKTGKSQKYCEIHGKCNHTTAQCEVIQKQREEYKGRINNNNKNIKDKNNERPKYNTRSNSQKNWEDNNNISINSNDEASDANSEINHIEEIFNIQDSEEKSDAICTEIRIQGTNRDGPSQLLLGLLDTGATGIFVKRTALKNIEHQVKKINIQVKGRYALSHLKEVALFNIKLPDFYNSHIISVRAYVEEEAVGRHDIILGIRFIHQLGLIFNFKQQTVTWDEIAIPMRHMGSIKPQELTSIWSIFSCSKHIWWR